MRRKWPRAILGHVALRCLIVDDNPGFVDVLREVLERDGIAVVGAAATSEEALARARELRPDVTLVDIDLGPESGLDVARNLAAAKDLGRLPVVLISTYAERDFVDLITGSPAVGFVSKSGLSARAIREVLGQTAATPASGSRDTR
jgi:DNA-binding NarL/FixJ family response regulator